MKSLDQTCSVGVHTPDQTLKFQNKTEFRGSILGELMDFVSSVPDFRRTSKGNIRHLLTDILMLMILGCASGHVGCSVIIEFGRYNLNSFASWECLGTV